MNINININIVNNFIYHKIIKINFINKKCIEIHEIIDDDKKKLKNITFNKYFIINKIFYYKNRL